MVAFTMTIQKILTTAILLATAAIYASDRNPDIWETADLETLRLPPVYFPQLPKEVRNDLNSRACTIPQAYHDRQRHNVISGHFQSGDQIDWAVLCSVDRLSTLLVYLGGSTASIIELVTTHDKDWLQDNADGNIGFSHGISTVGERYIIDHARWHGGIVPPVIDHEGIDDALLGKGSVVRYWYESEWLVLQGAD